MASLVERLAQVHVYLDSVHDASIKASRVSREKAIDLAKRFIGVQREAPAEHRLTPQFAQFVVCAWCLAAAQEEGELTQMGDWIGWSLSEEISDPHKVELHTGRLFEFRDAASLVTWPGYLPTMVTFFMAFYDYARRRTAMKNIGQVFWPLAMETLEVALRQPPAFIDPPEIFLGAMMLGWAAKESSDQAPKLTPLLEGIVSDQRMPSWCRALLCTTLATNAGRFSRTEPEAWARRALAEFEGHLVGLQKVQMMVTVLKTSDGAAAADAVLAEMETLQAKQRNTLGPLNFTRDAARKLEYVQPYFIKCLDMPSVDHVLRGLYAWYQLRHPDDPLDSTATLLTVPFGETSFKAVLGDVRYELQRDTQTLLEAVVRATNAFLGTAKSVAFADNSALEVPDRPGVPVIDPALQLENILREAYCPAGFEVSGKPTSQLTLGTEAHPIQATQLRAWGHTWPIAASLGRSRPDRRPKKVAVWSGGQLITEGMELDMVRFAFERSGAVVHHYAPETCTTEQFLDVYQDPEYDVFWVISHGEFDHWSPHEVKLHIARDGSTAALEELWERTPLGSNRRLLVLNVCDGGRFEEVGFVPRIGLAPGLAGPAQASISHLWPVMPFPSAAFGAYLAHFLATGAGYFDSYTETMRAIAKHAGAVAEELAALYGAEFELTRRLANRDEDWTSIEIAGSAAFFE
jgi:hypothetical protein